MARISGFPQFNPKDKDLSRFVKSLKITVNTMIQEINRIEGAADSTANILAQLQAIEARINALVAEIQADITEINALLAEAKVLAMMTAAIRTDLDALIVRVTAAEGTITTHTSEIATNTTNAATALSTANTANTKANAIRAKFIKDIVLDSVNDLVVTTSVNGTDTDKTLNVGDNNVQSDWNETDTEAHDYIKNKPTTITTAQANDINQTKARAELNTSAIGFIEANYIKDISFDNSTFEVEVTNQADTELKFVALPEPTLANAGKVLQQNAAGDEWILVSAAAAAGTADELAAFVYAGAINLNIPATIYAVNNVINARRWDPDTQAYITFPITATDAIFPAKRLDVSTGNQVDFNIALR